jgi:ABC-type amino acid transport substrate-binding protein/heat shock protein HslJ
MVVACNQLDVEPTPEPTPTPPSTPTDEILEDDSWERVKDAGKIIVGTSMNYPPFEFYVGPAQVDGLDIALMNEIGEHLGVEVEYHDLAFDGLGNALLLRQIDAAIAAISVTAERMALVGFSNVYFVSLDAILGQEDTEITIDDVQDLAGYRVGVQSGTVYEEWLQTTLVDTGLMRPANLHVYVDIGQALRDLGEGRLDLVVMDLPPAELAIEQGEFSIAGQGLNQQLYALALRKGDDALRTEINRVMSELQSEGKFLELAEHYLNLDPEDLAPLPTATPRPAASATPAPPAPCLDGLTFVEHVAPERESGGSPPELDPGEPFTKVWRVMNTGTCTWGTSYQVVYAEGNNPLARMGGEPTPVSRQVAPGETYDVKVDLVAPLRPGTYYALWQMENGKGKAFGERLPVYIAVPAPPTATPVPTQTPAPDVAFTVDRNQIQEGECVGFAWKVENVKEVYFYAEGEPWWENGVPGEGTAVRCPPTTTTYYLRVVYPNNTVDVREITIYVEPAPDAPQITRFTVDPPNQITLGQCVEIRWNVAGDVDEVTITAEDEVLWANAPLKGSIEDCPAQAGTVAYGIEAAGPGGTSRQQHHIRVVEPATATPAPTPAPELPVIYSFVVSPNTIAVGECTGISWSVGGGTSYARILRDGAVVIDDAGFTGQQMDCLDRAGRYTYRLEAYNPEGASVDAEQTVRVAAEPPANPLVGTSWQATAYYDQNAASMVPVLEGTVLTAVFGKEDQLNGSSGCNTYSAQYMVDGNALAIDDIGMTRTVCTQPEGIMEQEDAFVAALTSVASYTMEGNQLFLSDGSGQVVLEFVPYR